MAAPGVPPGQARPAPGTPCNRLGRSGETLPAGAPSPYRCPLPGVLATDFDPPEVRWAAGHRGIDLSAAAGARVSAPAAGIVSFTGMVAGRPVVTVDHGGGWRTSVEPVAGVVPQGARVVAGATIGTVAPGLGHCSPAVCVHLGVRHGDQYVDPTLLLRRAPVILLPLTR